MARETASLNSTGQVPENHKTSDDLMITNVQLAARGESLGLHNAQRPALLSAQLCNTGRLAALGLQRFQAWACSADTGASGGFPTS
eukprot:622387-Pyramimonas_sp.AAC.1